MAGHFCCHLPRPCGRSPAVSHPESTILLLLNLNLSRRLCSTRLRGGSLSSVIIWIEVNLECCYAYRLQVQHARLLMLSSSELVVLPPLDGFYWSRRPLQLNLSLVWSQQRLFYPYPWVNFSWIHWGKGVCWLSGVLLLWYKYVTVHGHDDIRLTEVFSLSLERLRVLTPLASCLHSLETTPCLDPVGGNEWILTRKRL